MAFTRPNLTRPLPRPAARRPRRAVQVSGGAGAPLSQVLGGTNFLVRTWIAFDPPNTALPTWIEITAFVEIEQTLTINHGRSDGLADANAATLSLTVDNSDGRFCASNPNGAWYGLIRKGTWIKVDILPVSGLVSNRFVGFITTLPTGWSGLYATSQITASDRFEKLGNAPALISMIEHEVLSDPNTGGNVKGYWNLHEPQGSLTFGDTSGQGARHLVATAAGGVAVGTGLTAANANAPGAEGLRTVTFSPPSSTTGTYLVGQITSPTGTFNVPAFQYTGLYGTLEFWFQATTVGVQQALAAAVDPVAQFEFAVFIDATGVLFIWIASTAVGNTLGSVGTQVSTARVDDGKWHHVVIGMAATSTGTGFSQFVAILDGATYLVAGAGTGIGSGNTLTRLLVGAAYDYGVGGQLDLGAANISDVSWSWTGLLNPTLVPNVADHYVAGTTGFLGESTDRRVARVARYAGIPTPKTSTVLVVAGGNRGLTPVYNQSTGPWTNLAVGAHLCASQSTAGRTALDVMREAARTEGTPLFVDRSGYLALQPSTIRQNTSPAWTVDSRDLDPDTGLQDDFAYTKNVMTVTPNQQAAQTVIGAAGQASQNKYGIYSGSLATASVNPTEAQSLGLSVIQLQADPVPRLAPIVVEAATLASQVGYGPAWYDAVLATEVSTPVRVTAIPAQAGGGNVDALIEGWTETITAGNHLFSFSTSPIQGPTYQLDDAVLGRVDTDGSVLAVACGPADTTLTVAVTGIGSGSAPWTTAAGDMPFDVNIGGEQVTVTAIGLGGFAGADGTFENGVANWSSTGATSATIAVSTADKFAGTQSALITNTVVSGSIDVRTPNVPVTPNTVYTYSHWIKLASTTGGAPSIAGRIDWYDASGAFISQSATGGASLSLTAWLNQTTSPTSPANAASARIGMGGNTAGTDGIYLDSVTFTPFGGSPQPFTVTRSVNAVPVALAAPADGTFETGVAGWTIHNGTFVSTTATAHTGVMSALMTVVGTPTQTYVRPPNVPVSANGIYTLTQWVRAASGSPSIVAAIDWFDATSTYISTSSGSSLPGPGAWTAMTYTATAPPTAAFATFGPLMVGSPPAGTAMYLDDVSFAANVVASHPAGTVVSLWTPLTLAY